MDNKKKTSGIVHFIQTDHRYAYLGGSVLAIICLKLAASQPSVSSFLGAETPFVLLLKACASVFLLVSALALIVKLTHWKTYSHTWIKNPGLVKATRFYSWFLAIVFFILAVDRLLIKLIDTVRECIALTSNPTEFFRSMIYMTYNGRGMMVYGIWTTVRLALLGTAIAFFLGILMVFLRIQQPTRRDNDFIKFIKTIAHNFAALYIFIIRGTPMMVQALIFYYAGFNIFTHYTSMSVSQINEVWSFFISGLITISLNSTAYLAEVLRGGIQAIDAGQAEAARSLGMTEWQTMVKVIFPQAIKNSIPAIGNEFIINIKDSSVLSVIGVMDLMFATKSVSGIYFRSLEIYCVAALIYLVLTYLSSLLLKYLSGKLGMSNSRGITSSN
ncbi:MAG: amino acid ABC transporter permease [Clostridiales bacterium]|nr:amino acid ABC transporter permease [Clostridiales bacterium]